MDTSLGAVPPLPPNGEGGTRLSRPRVARTDPFDQLLAMKSEAFASPQSQTDADLTSWPTALASGSTVGRESSSMTALLTLTLIQVLERLIDSSTPSTSSDAQPSSNSAAAATTLPVAGRISQGFHSGHQAVDIAVPVGTPVQATMAGRVVHAGWNAEGYGNLVIVENGPYRTYYAHLDSIPVSSGQAVAAGDVIGLSGNTGHSTGPHVHYEIRLNGQPISPGA